MTIATSYEQVTTNSPDGAQMGKSSTEKIAFYGATPIVRPSAITSVTTTGASSTTNAYGYTTAAQADAIVASLNAVITALGATSGVGLTA